MSKIKETLIDLLNKYGENFENTPDNFGPNDCLDGECELKVETINGITFLTKGDSKMILSSEEIKMLLND